MSIFGGGPSVPPTPVTPPPPPTVVDPPAQAGGDALRAANAMAAGRASTILTSGQGVLNQPPVLRRVLLGGS